MSQFDRRQLRYFIAVAEELHFGRAAKRLNISQPPLSIQIASLEADLNVQLFSRSKRHVSITPAGVRLLQDARVILAMMDKASADVQKAAEGQIGTLRIGLNYSGPLNPLLAKILRKFSISYPKVGIEFVENIVSQQLEGLNKNLFDVCLMWPIREDWNSDFDIHPISNDTIEMIVSQDFLRQHKTPIKPIDLKETPIYLGPRQLRIDFYDELMAACQKVGFQPTILTSLIQYPFIMNAVAARQAIGFVPAFLKRIKPESTVFLPCKFISRKASFNPLCLAHRHKEPSPLVKQFIDIALSVGRSS